MGYVFALKASAVQTFIESPTLSLDDGAIGWDAGEYVQVDFEVSSGTPTVQWFYFTNPANIDGTKTNISAGAVAPAPLLPVSAPNAYRAAYFMDTATFGGANADTRYIGCDVTIGATTERATYTVAAIGDIVGTPISQSTVGDGPYMLPLATTYYLSEDISTTGSAFFFNLSNTTLNLNGHTVTFDNDDPIAIVNHSFETVDPDDPDLADNWDFTNAPHATRFVGTWDDYLKSHMFDGDCSLKFDAANIADGVDEYITNDTPITLQPNTTYVINAHFMYGSMVNNNYTTNPGVTAYVQLMDGATPVGRLEYAGSNPRAIQLSPTGARNRGVGLYVESLQFTTGATPPAYTLRVGCIGKTGATVPFYIDRIKITKPWMYGVSNTCDTTSSANKQWYPDGPANNISGNNCVVKNGAVVQGQGSGIAARVISSTFSKAMEIHRLNITASGDDSHCIEAYENNSIFQLVKNCTITSNCQAQSRRDNRTAAMVFGVLAEVAYNTFLDGVSVGITTVGSENLIYGNVFRLKTSIYTNGFCIVSGSGADIYDNLIECGAGEYSARGIFLSGNRTSLSPTKCHHNRVDVQYLPVNQEYGGASLGGVYGIQIEASAAPFQTNNCDVYSNEVTAYADEVDAFALRINSAGANMSDVRVYDNLLRCIATSSRGGCLKIAGASSDLLDDNSIEIYDNTLRTNDGIISDTADVDLTIRRSTIIRDTPVADPYIISAEYSAITPHMTCTLVDNVYSDANARTYVESAIVRQSERYGGNPTGWGVVNLAWTTTIDANQIGGAPEVGSNVTITNDAALEVASGVTDANGQFVAEIAQQSVTSSTITDYNDHTVEVDNGAVMSTVFTADAAKTVSLTRS